MAGDHDGLKRRHVRVLGPAIGYTHRSTVSVTAHKYVLPKSPSAAWIYLPGHETWTGIRLAVKVNASTHLECVHIHKADESEHT